MTRIIRLMLVGILLVAALPGPGSMQASQEAQTTSQQWAYAETLGVGVLTVSHTFLELHWATWFDGRGLPAPAAGIKSLLPGDPPHISQCRNAKGEPQVVLPETENAGYCEKDISVAADGIEVRGLIIIPVMPLVRLLRGDIWGNTDLPQERLQATPPSHMMYFMLAIIGHEWGHVVEDSLKRRTGFPPPAGANSELFADCLAGEYVRLFSPPGGAVMTVRSALGQIADPEEGGSHGVATQRIEAFDIGFEPPAPSDDPALPKADCFATYWPDLPVR
jgi:hypothetical protein